MADSVSKEKADKIRALVKEMELYSNPQEIEDLKKLIKKNVPFWRRGYFSAYLYLKSELPAKPVAKETKKKASRENQEDTVTFYINVGKASHSPAKDLAQFIAESAGLLASDIVSIAYKQNYSFVYIKKAKADHVIDSVNGQTFKGRKVKINYSKEKNAEQEN